MVCTNKIRPDGRVGGAWACIRVYRVPVMTLPCVHSFAAIAVGLVVAVSAMAMSGCQTISGMAWSDATVVVRSSSDQAVSFESTLPTYVYAWFDANTADVYLTDLSPEALRSPDIAAGDGNLVHLHMFMNPSAGLTPIADTACSVTVRHVVFAKGRVGIYGGGGFLNPSGKPGDPEFGGKVRDATVRLLSSTAGFEDKLGPAMWTTSFRALNNRATALVAAEKLRATIAAIAK